jgi:DNA mismatch endonuclease (patch repair protein)
MASVKSRNTGPELEIRKALYASGVRGWRCNYKRVAGRPDIAWPARKIAVFVDGAFWHGHPTRHKPGRSGEYWDRKIAQNVERDRRVDRELRKNGWAVLRLWDFEIRKDLNGSVARVVDVLGKSSVASSAHSSQTVPL